MYFKNITIWPVFFHRHRFIFGVSSSSASGRRVRVLVTDVRPQDRVGSASVGVVTRTHFVPVVLVGPLLLNPRLHRRVVAVVLLLRTVAESVLVFVVLAELAAQGVLSCVTVPPVGLIVTAKN